jgi:peptidoglycan/LPS O-acetylase OafA/YrhL
MWEVFNDERSSLMELRTPFDGFVEKAVRATTTCLICDQESLRHADGWERRQEADDRRSVPAPSQNRLGSRQRSRSWRSRSRFCRCCGYRRAIPPSGWAGIWLFWRQSGADGPPIREMSVSVARGGFFGRTRIEAFMDGGGVEKSQVARDGHIDGLRAVAVVIVILFHANFLDGGFVGVDVFFVISGFVITRMVLQDLSRGSFAFADFFERRARRILPALFLVLIATCAVAYFVTLPADMPEVAQTAASASLFFSNIVLRKLSGYFNVEADLKPLLHTWSLSVEFQIYIIFPFIIAFSYRRFGINAVVVALALIAGVSFWHNISMIAASKTRNAFFYLEGRAWEFLIGGILAAVLMSSAHDKICKVPRILWGLLSIFGLALILWAAMSYSKYTIFPGMGALIPSLGAAAIILGNSMGVCFVGRLLSIRYVVFIGTISYSLYLWHWPIFSFSRYIALNPLMSSDFIVLIVVCTLISILSWRLIEIPFRDRKKIPLRALAVYGIAYAVAMASYWQVSALSDGMRFRVPAAVIGYTDGARDRNPLTSSCSGISIQRISQKDYCFVGASREGARFILWGDSHADSLHPLFGELSRKTGVSGLVLGTPGCLPRANLAPKSPPECGLMNEAVLEEIQKGQVDTVFIASNWRVHIQNEESAKIFIDGMSAALARILPHVKEVVLFDQVPKHEKQIPFLAARLAAAGRSLDQTNINRNEHDAKSALSRSAIDVIRRKYYVSVIDPADIFCDDAICRTIDIDAGRSYYWNGSHLNNYGAGRLAPLVEPYFEAIRRRVDGLPPH